MTQNFVMRYIFIFILLALPGKSLFAQALTAINFRELYNPESEISITLQPVSTSQKVEIFYQIQSNQTLLDKYSITWEKRESYTQREGTPLTNTDSISLANTIKGLWVFDVPSKPWLLVAKVTNIETKKSWVHFKMIEKNFPVNGWFEQDNNRLTKKYLIADQPYPVKSKINGNILFVSYYNEDFPAAYPPFAEKESNVDRFLFHDSIFQISTGSPVTLKKTGLYLFQKDTAASEGVAVRVVNKSFPRFSKIEDLMKPLIFVCTQDEYTALQNAKGDKAKFDKVVLDITRDKEKAANFMKSYFRRVELANLYFSSFKEGWKTDRGMIYLIFGLPDEVSMNDSNETWHYNNTRARFTFVKSGSVYDPENYVLLRDKRFMEPWFSTVDLWRKSRF